MPADLFGEPLKSLPIFLRTRALTFVFDVACNLRQATRTVPPSSSSTVQRNRAAEQFIFLNARLLDVDYGASRYVPWSAIDNHRLPSCVYVTPVSVRWW